MSSKRGLVLFDFDYTLADPSGWVFDALRSGLSAARLPAPTTVSMKSLIGIPLEEQFTTLGGSIDDQAMFRQFKTAYVEHRAANALAKTRIIAGVPETLRVLTNNGLLLGIVSTGAETRIRHILSSAGLIARFEQVVGGLADKASGITQAVRATGIPETAAIYVGDRPDDGESAARANVRFIAVLTGAFRAKDFPPTTEILRTVNELPEHLDANTA